MSEENYESLQDHEERIKVLEREVQDLKTRMDMVDFHVRHHSMPRKVA